MPTRRQFLARTGAAAAVVIAPQEALAQEERKKRRRRPRRPANMLRGGRFEQGVLSGDPGPNGITLLTVVDGTGDTGRVRLEVARDPGFRHVVARRDILTTPDVGHSVKARVTGLKPHKRYWYRFETRDRHSPVGRFQTALPPDSRATVRFGFFSCASYTAGYYNAYELLAREDLDFVLCLGDYIYAETYHDVASGTAVRDDTIGKPNPHYDFILREAGTLPEYRAKYRLYRSDPALRRLHQTHPMIAIWDDHEVQNNYANGAPDGGLTLRADFSRARRDASYRAFFESMPVFPRARSRIYRALRHGRTVELMMLDSRQYRDDQPCRDRIAFPCGSWNRPRSLLGGRQRSFVERRLSASDAAWKVVGGQSLMMPNRVHDGQFTRFDSWQGYPQEREHVLQHILQTGIEDVVFVSGDAHTIIAGDACVDMGAGAPVAPEFSAGSVTSASPGEINYRMPGGQLLPGNPTSPATPPEAMAHYRGLNPWFDQLDLDHHGYGVVTASQSTFDVTLKRLATVRRRNLDTLPATGFRWRMKRGQRSIRGTAV
jgi:alkaline phosphatase D